MKIQKALELKLVEKVALKMGTLFSYGKWGSFKRQQRAQGIGSLSASTDANSDAFETAFGLASVSSITQKLKAVKAALKAWNLQVFGKVDKKKSKR